MSVLFLSKHLHRAQYIPLAICARLPCCRSAGLTIVTIYKYAGTTTKLGSAMLSLFLKDGGITYKNSPWLLSLAAFTHPQTLCS